MQPTAHDLLLQKSTGLFELVVWSEKVSGTNDITVNLGKSHAAVKIYDITSGTVPIQTLINVAHFPLTLSDHALVIETD
jgi:hypothetical protein